MFASANNHIPHHLARTSPIPTDPVYHNYKNTCRTAPPGNRRSPIPKDPTYADKAEYKITTPKPRVKPEALNIARNHQGKDLAYLFNPGYKVLPIGVRHSHRTPRDHEKENYRKIKEIQKANREKQSESARSIPVKAVYKPDKFEHVQSKVAQQIQTPVAPRRPSTSPKLYRSKSSSDIDKSRTYAINNKNELTKNNPKNKNESNKIESKRESNEIDKNDNVGKRPSSAMSNGLKENDNIVQKRPPRPSSACEVEKVKKEPLSHIALNKQAVQKVKLKKNPTESALQELNAKKENEIKKYKRGNVPKYLRNRQTEWKKAEEERIANLPDPTVPPGHTVMSNAERERTLDMLQQSQQEMLDELQKIPLSRDTMRIQRRKDFLERKLTEIDSALKIFSRPRVFISDD